MHLITLKCNALNARMCELHRLKMLINAAARVISGRIRFDHITDSVKHVLQWLPITQGIYLKAFTLVYKASRGVAPTYLSDLIVKSMVIRLRCDFRSSAHSQLFQLHIVDISQNVLLRLVVQCYGIRFLTQFVMRHR